MAKVEIQTKTELFALMALLDGTKSVFTLALHPEDNDHISTTFNRKHLDVAFWLGAIRSTYPRVNPRKDLLAGRVQPGFLIVPFVQQTV